MREQAFLCSWAFLDPVKTRYPRPNRIFLPRSHDSTAASRIVVYQGLSPETGRKGTGCTLFPTRFTTVVASPPDDKERDDRVHVLVPRGILSPHVGAFR